MKYAIMILLGLLINFNSNSQELNKNIPVKNNSKENSIIKPSNNQSFKSIIPSNAYMKDNSTINLGYITTEDPSIFNIEYSASTGSQGAGSINPSGEYFYLLSFSEMFIKIDMATGVETLLGNLVPPGSHQWEGAAFDPENGDFYVVASQINSTNSSLFILDIEQVTLSFIGNLNFDSPQGLAFDKDANLYSFGNDDMFYSIDKTNGDATAIGNLGYDVKYYQGIAWNPFDETMYLNAHNEDNQKNELRTVNLTTGSSNLIGEINPDYNTNFGWISFKNEVLAVPEYTMALKYILLENPVSEYINLKLNTTYNYSDVSIKLFTITGQHTLTHKVNTITDLISIPHNLNSGIYFLNIKDSEGDYTMKIIIN